MQYLDRQIGGRNGSRLRALAAGVLACIVLGFSAVHAEEPRPATLYKNPQCGCCEEYAHYLEDHGFKVAIKPTDDHSSIKRMAGAPERLEACHTLLINGYVVEGHVPVETLNRLLTERPDIKGISLPGMPLGSPGMTGRKTEPFTIYEISDGRARIFAVE